MFSSTIFSLAIFFLLLHLLQLLVYGSHVQDELVIASHHREFPIYLVCWHTALIIFPQWMSYPIFLQQQSFHVRMSFKDYSEQIKCFPLMPVCCRIDFRNRRQSLHSIAYIILMAHMLVCRISW